VVEQVAPDGGNVQEGRDAGPAQLVGWPDAGQQQQVRRPERPGTEHVPVGRDDVVSAGPRDLQPGRPAAAEEQAPRVRQGPDLQVGPLPGGGQVRDRGAQPQAADVVERDRRDPRRVRPVGVRALPEAEAAGGLVERRLGGQPPRACIAPHRRRAVAPVPVVVEVEVGLDRPECRQQRREVPPGVARPAPGVEVLGQPAQEDLPVDGAAPADDLSPGDRPELLRPGEPALEVPQVRRRDHVALGLPEPELGRQVLEPRVVGARLDHDDVAPGVLAQAGGDDGAGRPGADDGDVVEAAQPAATGTGSGSP